MQPYEIVCAPYTAYVASVGTTFPLVDTPPTLGVDDWTLVGTSGNKNYDDTGVTVTHGQTVSTFTPAGSTTPRKAWRTEETLTVGFTLADVSPTQYALVMDSATITTVAAGADAPGTSSFELMRGIQMKMYALIVRGISSVDETLSAQYQIPACYQSGTPAPVYSKQNPAELAVEFTAFEETAGVFGELVVQTAAKT